MVLASFYKPGTHEECKRLVLGLLYVGHIFHMFVRPHLLCVQLLYHTFLYNCSLLAAVVVFKVKLQQASVYYVA